MLDSLARDLRLAARSLRANPGFTLIVIFTLALGIGASTAIFSVVHRVLLVPLPFAAPEEVVMVWENDRLTGTTREASSVPDFYDFEERSRSFAALAAYARSEMNSIREGGEPARVSAARVSHDLISLLGVTPRLGRSIQASEDQPGGARVALLSDDYWRRSFGADPRALGRVLNLDDEPYEIVGVLPAGLDFPDRDTDVWLPLQQGRDSAPRSRHWIDVVGRLAPGVTVAAARQEMDRIAADLEREHAENRARGAFVEPLGELLRGGVRPALLVLLAAVLCVLLIACANVAGLLLARGAARARDQAVRIALGSGVRHLVRQHLVESLLLTVTAAAAGVALAIAGLRGLLALAPAAVGDAARSNPAAALGGLLLKPALGGLRRELHPDTTGGAILLGLRGIAVVSHGSSGAAGIANAVLPDDEVLPATLAKAREIARMPVTSLVAIKRLMKQAHSEQIARARALEMEGMVKLAGTRITECYGDSCSPHVLQWRGQDDTVGAPVSTGEFARPPLAG